MGQSFLGKLSHTHEVRAKAWEHRNSARSERGGGALTLRVGKSEASAMRVDQVLWCTQKIAASVRFVKLVEIELSRMRARDTRFVSL